MTRYTPKHLNEWTKPVCYIGETWETSYSAGVGQSRDSEALERANFIAVERALGELQAPENWPHDEPTYQIVRESHWAVGWVEWIAIHPDATDHLTLCDGIAKNLEDYPVIDELLHSEIENEDCIETWSNCYDNKERAAYLREHLSSVDGNFRDLIAAVRGEWGSAADLLPCPSDLLYC